MSAQSLDDLLAIEAIRQLKARYCRFVDTKQWDRLAGVFAPGARLDGLGSAPDGSDAATFVAGISKRLARVISIHHVHNPEITITGPGIAQGIWPMMDYLEFPADERPSEAPESRGFVGYGFYEEEYRKVGDTWLIAHLRLTRMRVDALAQDHPLPRFGRHKPSPDWL
ncbi:MAG: nuclear transport factor 2 family protein [Hyphomicrobiaceae bacterium]|nr:nuclear transport factor 2 family protein [Hyphomicrobiaceae bacterium]